MTNILSATQLQNPFLFSNHEVRTALDDKGDAWFCAKDVCAVLDIQWSGRGNTLRSVPEDWVMVSYHETIKGDRETIFISEPAVYQISFRSNKPEAILFTKWVCAEVLPTLRRQGFYGTLTASQQIALRNQKIKLIERLATLDAFIYQSVLTSLRTVCNQLGEPMPDPALLGRDRHQLPLGV